MAERSNSFVAQAYISSNVFGAASPDNRALSDRICSGLQLVEHFQEVTDRAGQPVAGPTEDDVKAAAAGVGQHLVIGKF